MGVNDGDGAFQQAFCVPAVPLHENVLMGGERSWGAQGSTTPRVLTPPNRALFSWAIAQDRPGSWTLLSGPFKIRAMCAQREMRSHGLPAGEDARDTL